MISSAWPARYLAFSLAGLAGFVDAIGFLALGGYFASFMSGNSTRLAVGIVNATRFQLTTFVPLAIIVVFVGGVMLGAAVRSRAAARPATAVMVIVSVSLLLAALASSIARPASALLLAVLAMGCANNVFVRDGEVTTGVTYMTGTLVKFGQHLQASLSGESNRKWLTYLALWFGLAVGALLGAIGYSFLGLQTLWIATLAAAAMCAFSLTVERF